jgi:hypothetical protein
MSTVGFMYAGDQGQWIGCKCRATETIEGYLIVKIPEPGESPSYFRREFLFSVKTAIQTALRSRSIDAAIAEECWRVLPSYGGRS